MLVPASATQHYRKQIYSSFRRRLEEERGIYRLEWQQHHCWTEPEQLHVARVSVSENFYGCLTCGRSHWCSAPEYASCPRAPASTFGEYACPYSGVVLDAGSGAHFSVLGSYNIQNEAYTAVREAKRRTARDDAFLAGPAIGSKVARALASRGKFAQADVARDSVWQRHQMREYQRLGGDYAETRDAKLRQQEVEDRRMPWQRNADVENRAEDAKGEAPKAAEFSPEADFLDANGGAEDDMEPWGEDDGHGTSREGAKSLRSTQWTSQPVLIPPSEGKADAAYLSDALEPVLVHLRRHVPAWGEEGTFKPPSRVLEPDAAAVPSVTAPAAPAPLRAARWPLLRRDARAQDYLPHQNMMLHYVQAFLAHFTPLLSGRMRAAPTPLDAHEYVRLCDTVVLLYLTFHPSPLSLVAVDQPARIVRLLFVLLTYVFTSSYHARDPVTRASIPVLLPDPWLSACRRHLLFRDLQALPRALAPSGTASGQANFEPTKLGNALLDGLDYCRATPHGLYQLLHPTPPPPPSRLDPTCDEDDPAPASC